MRTVFVLFFLAAPFTAATQTHQENTAQFLADRLRDSLVLSAAQHQQLFRIHLIMEEEKTNVRSLPQDQVLTRKKVQRIENTRDSLYQRVLTPAQFDRYKDRKVSLLNMAAFHAKSSQ